MLFVGVQSVLGRGIVRVLGPSSHQLIIFFDGVLTNESQSSASVVRDTCRKLREMDVGETAGQGKLCALLANVVELY